MIFRDTTAIEAVNNGQDTPDAFYHKSTLIATSKWHSTDAWRGYTEVTAEPGYKILDSDWMTGDWGDAVAAEHGETPTEARLEKLEQEYRDLFVIYTPTSNVFSTAIDVVVRDPDVKPVRGKTIAHKTKLFTDADGSWRVRYHATDVVSFNATTGKYTLDTGGWNTMTTAKRMSEHLPSGYHVYRHQWVLYLREPGSDNKWGADRPVTDGMEV